MNNRELEQIFDFLHFVRILKYEQRFKTVENIDGDTVASHVWRLGLFAILLIKKFQFDLDSLKVLKLIIIHDLAESITGDFDASYVYNGHVDKKEKDELEIQAIEKLLLNLPSDLSGEIRVLWTDYNSKNSEEAKFAYVLDKIEGSMTQLEAGHKAFKELDLSATYPSNYIHLYPGLKPVLKQHLREMKELYKKSGFDWKDSYNYNLE